MLIAPSDPTATLTRVLCVDDNPDVADSEVMLLGLWGFDARACYGGREALALAEMFQPRVCLLDVHMPGMDGRAVAAGLRVWAGRRPLSLIAVTAARHLPDLTQGGVFDLYLFKPVAPERLLAAVAGPAGRRIPFPGRTARAAAADASLRMPEPPGSNNR